MDDKTRKLAREMAKKAAEGARAMEDAVRQSENTAKQALDQALRNFCKKHPELSGMITFGDTYLPGNGSQSKPKEDPRARKREPDAKEGAPSPTDVQTEAASMADGEKNPGPTPVSVSVSVAVDPPAFPHSPAIDTRDTGDDDYWSMPAPKASAYRPPSLQGHSLDTVPVETDTAAEPVTEPIPKRDEQTAQRERAPSRYTRPADRTYPPAPAREPVTDPFPEEQSAAPDSAGLQKREAPPDGHRFPDTDSARFTSSGGIVAERDGEGALLRHITVRAWINDFVFYGRFARDAQRSHRQTGNPAYLARFVPFTSYLPQYSQMSRNQLCYYLAFRDSVRADKYPDFPGAGTAYILLYAYEILNLPEEIPPETGMRLLCGMWRHYRESDPRIDTFFGEWVADYSMIHNVPLSPVIHPCLPQIVKKAQFKEFYLDTLLGSDDAVALVTDIFMEGFSDYDYKTSRYYRMHEREYDRTMHDVLERVLSAAYHAGREPFSLAREYRINRDAYAGAIAQTEVKKRLSITFLSFLRSEKPREWVTGVLKYTENRLRKRMALRAKLRVDALSPADQAVIDAYFGADPEPEKKKPAAQPEEEAYLRRYDADTHGFDFSAAGEIEKASWDNTVRLTDAETAGADPETDADMPTDNAPATAQDDPMEAENRVPGELGMDAVGPDEPSGDGPAEEDGGDSCAVHGEQTPPAGAYAVEKAALAEALDGRFAAYCRSIGEFPGRMAERINEIFMDEMGDIVLTAEYSAEYSADYSVVEDYREEAEEWSKS